MHINNNSSTYRFQEASSTSYSRAVSEEIFHPAYVLDIYTVIPPVQFVVESLDISMPFQEMLVSDDRVQSTEQPKVRVLNAEQAVVKAAEIPIEGTSHRENNITTPPTPVKIRHNPLKTVRRDEFEEPTVHLDASFNKLVSEISNLETRIAEVEARIRIKNENIEILKFSGSIKTLEEIENEDNVVFEFNTLIPNS